eukprot:TRINITY_DN2370_c0_g1_i2.p1 TRINITY_DN2370_c0_g1~~TRINITY_DN2370_c0_g1_i2.p1  ORF type:complete len:787 (+),score=145.28 TRINITY_DN2370_c0_g1_i2:308-2668(+)
MINILITAKPFQLFSTTISSDSCCNGIETGHSLNVAFGKPKKSILFQNISSTNTLLRKQIFKALKDSGNKLDAQLSVSGRKDSRKNKKEESGHSPTLSKSISSILKSSDISKIKVSEFFHQHSTSGGGACSLTGFSDLSCEEVFSNENGFLVEILEKLEAVRLNTLALEQWNAPHLKECHRNYFASARNLIHYVSLRTVDIHQLQEALAILGLSNLDGSNEHVIASLTSIIKILEKLTQQSPVRNTQQLTDESAVDGSCSSNLQSSRAINSQLLEGLPLLQMKRHTRHNVESLLGPVPSTRQTHIMLTLGKEAAEDKYVVDLIKSGVSLVRINCAHDGPDIWKRIIMNVRKSSQMLEKPCRILMDLAGPKLRTGSFSAALKLRRIKPVKDAKGVVVSPASVWIAPPGLDPPSHKSIDAIVPVQDKQWIRRLESGDVLKFSDARRKKRLLKILETYPVSSEIGCLAESYKTSYVETDTEFRVKGKKSIGIGKVSELPVIQQYIRVKKGELLIITRDPCMEPSPKGRDGVPGPSRVTCSAGLLFDSVKPGEPIEFDDGKIQGVIRGVNTSEICVEITHAGENGTKLGPEKSINVPKSKLMFEGLTVKDLMDLDFIGANADMVGVSFVNNVNDVNILQQELKKRELRNLGIVLKIETKSGFESLPLLLLQAMKSPNPLGVMIARGDLAVECGWEKLAEMQEEILMICEAAHIPCVWATQVLENLAKSGLPTRAEITDAAVASRTACVMLNKGKHIKEAIITLDSILQSTSLRQARMKPALKPLLFSSLF